MDKILNILIKFFRIHLILFNAFRFVLTALILKQKKRKFLKKQQSLPFHRLYNTEKRPFSYKLLNFFYKNVERVLFALPLQL